MSPTERAIQGPLVQARWSRRPNATRSAGRRRLDRGPDGQTEAVRPVAGHQAARVLELESPPGIIRSAVGGSFH